MGRHGLGLPLFSCLINVHILRAWWGGGAWYDSELDYQTRNPVRGRVGRPVHVSVNQIHNQYAVVEKADTTCSYTRGPDHHDSHPAAISPLLPDVFVERRPEVINVTTVHRFRLVS